jgi:CTP:molybdopterin cytidylyltransferase MocA
MKKVSVIIAAAGKSERFVSPFGVKKQFFNLFNKPVVL